SDNRQSHTGVRIPNSAVALRILRATGPLAATSANRSGEESAQTVQEAADALGDAVDLYLTGERLRDMCRPRWSPPTRTSATASRFFGRE
ncbi:Sua5/YciO/YrdC/YwlC family protein, partial [human gut metagenome]